jgi:hypothetical protein
MHINEEPFADLIVNAFVNLMARKG